MKKIVITIKDKNDKTGNCSVNIKMEQSKSETEAEKLTASAVYTSMLEKLHELEKIK